MTDSNTTTVQHTTLQFDTAQWTTLQRMRIRTIAHSPYLASLVFATTFVPAPGLGTMAIDDRLRLYVDPQLLDQWTPEENAGVMTHEVHHVLRMHGNRARAVDAEPTLWNVAADMEINDDLVHSAITLPGSPMLPSTFGLEAQLTCEEYYEQLQHILDEDSDAAQCGSAATGCGCSCELIIDSDEYPGVPSFQIEAIRREVAEMLVRQAGWAPAGLVRWATDHLTSTVDWRRQLTTRARRGLLRRAGQADYTWSRPNRRHPGRVLLPSLRSPVIRAAVVIDTSASMSNDDLSAAYSEARLLCRQIDRDNAVLVACDVEPVVIARGTFPESAPLIGGGGTNMGAALDLLALERRPPDVIVVLTDGATPWPDTLPDRLRNSHVVVGHIASGVDSTEFNWPEWCSVVKIGG